MHRPLTATLARTWLPQAGVQYDVLKVLVGSFFIALCAQIAIPLPFTPVPITGQTLGVLLTAALLGSRLGALTIVAYLAEGAAGLPVFAPGGAIGIARFYGPTAGYLIGWLPAAFLVGWLAERGWDRKFWTTALAMVLGNLIIYVGGIAGLARYFQAEERLMKGMIPFLIGDAIKIILAAAALPGAWALTDRAGHA